MSIELQEARQSQEELRSERRMIFQKLREVSRCFGEMVEDDSRLSSIINELAALAAREGLQSGGSSDSKMMNAAETSVLGEVACEERQYLHGLLGQGDGSAAGALVVAPAVERRGTAETDCGSPGSPGTPCSSAPPTTPCSTPPGTPVVPSRPGKFRSWQPDARRCAICLRGFGLVAMRHHCRNCGRNVCGHCSPYRMALAMPLPHPVKGISGPHRVCSVCHEPAPLRGQQL